jgi:hypothetical protein
MLDNPKWMTSSKKLSYDTRPASLTRCWSFGHNVKSLVSRPAFKRNIKYKRGDDINIKYKRGDDINIKYKRADHLYFIQIITVYNVYQICNKIITDFISGFLNALFIVCLHC